MKRKLVFTLLILLLFNFVLANCSAQSSNNDQRIVGTWIYNGTTDNGTNYSITYVFNANGSGTFTNTHPNLTGNYTFIYGISITGEIIFSEVKGTGVRTISSGKIYFSPDAKMLIIGENTAYRKK